MVGQCATHVPESIKNIDFPGKKLYKSHQSKVDAVADIILDKKKDPTATDKDKKGAEKGSDTNLSAVGARNLSACTTATSSSRNSFAKGKKVGIVMGLKLYHISDSPPCLAVRMGLKYLGLECELIDVDFLNGEQASEDYKKKNPQGEIPLLDDNGFLLSESVAILQYLAEKYKVDGNFYPSDPQQRAVINHRLAFHLTTYYKAIAEYVLLPLCYAYPRTDDNLKKVNHAVGVLQEILSRQNGSYIAGSELTIADLPFVMGTVLLEVIGFNLSPYSKVKSWFEGFKTNQSELWKLANQGLMELKAFEKNPPDLSHLKHPLHPTDRTILKLEESMINVETVSPQPAVEDPIAPEEEEGE